MRLIVCVIWIGLALILPAHSAEPSCFIIGHRGMGAHHVPEPENSVRAIRGALEIGVGAVEFDLQLSKDGEVILAHDPSLSRMTDGKGCVAETNFEDLRKLRLRDGDGVVHPDTVSTFAEALEAAEPYDNPSRPFLADIHIKTYDGMRGDWGGWRNRCPKTDYATLTRKTIEVLEKYGLTGRVMITAFDRRVLDIVKAAHPEMKVGLLSGYLNKRTVKRARKFGYDAVAIHHKVATKGGAELARKYGIQYYVWSPNDTKSMRKYIAAYQVDGVITDDLSKGLQACEK